VNPVAKRFSGHRALWRLWLPLYFDFLLDLVHWLSYLPETDAYYILLIDDHLTMWIDDTTALISDFSTAACLI
jgi:hypothetical protein